MQASGVAGMQKLTEFQGRNGVLAWSLLAGLYAWALIWFSLYRPFAIDISVFGKLGPIICGMVGLMLALGLAKDRLTGSEKRLDIYIRHALSSIQLFIACYFFLLLYAMCSTVMTYMGQAVGAPLQDEALATADAALGIDFLAFHAWVGTQPLLPEAMFYAYNSCAKQFLVIFLVSAIFLDRENVAQFCSLLVLTIVPTIIIATLFPALGSCIYHQPTAQPFAHLDPLACRDYVPHVESLRAGTFEVFDLRQSKGLLTFPSYHTVMAIIATYAVRNYIWLLIPFALLNAVNILSTVPFGGHYFVDVLGGATIAFSAIAIVRWNAARQPLGAAGSVPLQAPVGA
jgi:membrane-associated phospholipid phosphatase